MLKFLTEAVKDTKRDTLRGEVTAASLPLQSLQVSYCSLCQERHLRTSLQRGFFSGDAEKPLLPHLAIPYKSLNLLKKI